MTRGDQRERDRAKRQTKEASKNKTTGREGTPSARNLDDKAALQAKVAAKKAAKEAEASAGADPLTTTTTKAAPVARKKVAKKTEILDDLLDAGLTKAKKTRK